MKYKAKDIIEYIENFASPNLQEVWDNSGWQLTTNRDVTKIIICMDVTLQKVELAINEKAELIISHHPLFFEPIKSITNDYKSKIIRKLIENQIGVYSAHTSLDIAKGGVNDTLFDFLKLQNPQPLILTEQGNALGLIGENTLFKTLKELIEYLEENLLEDGFRLYGNKKDKINKIGIMGGSGAGEINSAIDRCDVYITSDVKHHEGQLAYENDLLVLDISHNDSEKLILDKLKMLIQDKFKVECIVEKENAFMLKLE